MKSLLALLALSALLAGQVSAQSLTGDWTGTLNTPGAQVPLNLVLAVKGDSLTGTVKRVSGDVPLFGVVRGDSVAIEYTIQYNESPFTLRLSGRVKGDSLSGIVDFGEGNQDAFQVTRLKKSG